MIIGIEGAIGSGKTIMMVRYLYKDYKIGNRIQANFKLEFGEPLDVLSILDMGEHHVDIQNVSIGIDEITVFSDCRRSMSKMNLILSYFILQTRKRNVQLYYTTQDLSMVDVRLYRHTDIVVFCDYIYKNNEALTNWRQYKIFDFRDRRRPTITRFDMDISKYWGLYDTNEVILPPI